MTVLVDLENTGSSIYNDIKLLKGSDTLVIFYSAKSAKMTMNIHVEIEKLLCKKEYICIQESSKNALDFQLATYLGYIIGKSNTKEKYAIISKDNDFNSICTFWKDNNYSVNKYNSISSAVKGIPNLEIQTHIEKQPTPKKESKSTKSKTVVQKKTINKTNEKIKVALHKININKNDEKKVLDIFTKNKTKQGLNNALVQAFNSTQGGAIYKILKPHLTK